MKPDLFSQFLERRVKQIKLPRIRLHDVRHSHATLALAAGIHPKVVSERLGHASVAFTLNVYSHAIPAMEEQAAEQIAALSAAPALTGRREGCNRVAIGAHGATG